MPVPATVVAALILLLGTLLLAGLGGVRTLLCLLCALLLAGVPAVAAALAVFPPAIAAVILLFLPLRHGFLAGYQCNQLPDKSKSHLFFL
jgi:hypothetical protein